MADDLQQNDDIIVQGLANLVSQFKQKEKLEAFLAVFLKQIQELEVSAFQIKLNRALDTAVGVQLDGLGEIIGLAREGLDDDAYRDRLRGQILVNITNGRAEELIAMVALFGVSPVLVQQFDIHAFEISADSPLTPGLGATLGRLIKAAKGGGVNGIFRWFESATPFEFSATSSPVPADPQGFGDTGDPLVGGDLSAASRG